MAAFKLTKENVALTEDEKKIIEKAKKMPAVFDEDCPELSGEMEKAFIAARKAKPRGIL